MVVVVVVVAVVVVGWLVGWSVGRSVGRSVGWLVGGWVGGGRRGSRSSEGPHLRLQAIGKLPALNVMPQASAALGDVCPASQRVQLHGHIEKSCEHL